MNHTTGELIEQQLAELFQRSAVLMGAAKVRIPVLTAGAAFKRAYARELTMQCGGNQSRAARETGTHRNTLSRLNKAG